MCLSESYFSISYHSDDDQLALPGYNLVRVDNPNNIKRGRVCVYFPETLPVNVINGNVLNEWLVCEFSFGSCHIYLVSIYLTPSQSSNEFDTFLVNLKNF